MPPLDERDPLHPDNFDAMGRPLFLDTARLTARDRARNWRAYATPDYLQWFDTRHPLHRVILGYQLRHPLLLGRLSCTCGHSDRNPFRLHPWQWEGQCRDCLDFAEEEAWREYHETELERRVRLWARQEFKAA
jgi:hypothetical protein